MSVFKQNNKILLNSSGGVFADERDTFITIWKTDNTGTSDDNQITLPTYSTSICDFDVDWGDGSSDHIETSTATELTHTYTSIGTYTVKIKGKLDYWRFGNNGDKLKFLEIKQWGDLQSKLSYMMFYGCSNLDVTAIDSFNTTHGLDNMQYMFRGCTNLKKLYTTEWDVSNVKYMNYMFHTCTNFNSDLSSWDVSSVKSMSYMLHSCINLNSDISDWVVSSVTDMRYMFYNCSSFNSDISLWNVESVIHMLGMFTNCSNFNSDISDWVVSSVTSLAIMFNGCTNFNSELNDWDVSSVSNMNSVFRDCISFNQDISGWDVGTVTIMNDILRNVPEHVTNYSNMLIAWDSLTSLQNGVTLGADLQKYNDAGGVARQSLIDTYGWTITDAGHE